MLLGERNTTLLVSPAGDDSLLVDIAVQSLITGSQERTEQRMDLRIGRYLTILTKKKWILDFATWIDTPRREKLYELRPACTR